MSMMAEVEQVPAFSLSVVRAPPSNAPVTPRPSSVRSAHHRDSPRLSQQSGLRLPLSPRVQAAAIDPEVARRQHVELTRLIEREKVLVAAARMRYRDVEFRIRLVAEAAGRRSGRLPDEGLSSLVAIGLPAGVNAVRYEHIVRRYEAEAIASDPEISRLRQEIASLRAALEVPTHKEKKMAQAEARRLAEQVRAQQSRAAQHVLRAVAETSTRGHAEGGGLTTPCTPRRCEKHGEESTAATTTPVPPTASPADLTSPYYDAGGTLGSGRMSPRQRVSPYVKEVLSLESPHVEEVLWSAPAAAATAVAHVSPDALRRLAPFPRPWIDPSLYAADLERIVRRHTTSASHGRPDSSRGGGRAPGLTSSPRASESSPPATLWLLAPVRDKSSAASADGALKAFLSTTEPLLTEQAKEAPIDYTVGERAAMETLSPPEAVAAPVGLHAPTPSWERWRQGRSAADRMRRARSARERREAEIRLEIVQQMVGDAMDTVKGGLRE